MMISEKKMNKNDGIKTLFQASKRTTASFYEHKVKLTMCRLRIIKQLYTGETYPKAEK